MVRIVLDAISESEGLKWVEMSEMCRVWLVYICYLFNLAQKTVVDVLDPQMLFRWGTFCY